MVTTSRHEARIVNTGIACRIRRAVMGSSLMEDGSSRLDACQWKPRPDGTREVLDRTVGQAGVSVPPKAAPIWVRSLEKSMGLGW